ncbi:MAG: tetraacyldisaccharide 4'-kinase, partial [Candidatus Latescibacterota bacterium]
FQYRTLARDVDIVVLDARDPLGGGHLLPWGRLREPPSALRRADVVCISRVDQVSPEALKAIHGKVAGLAPEAILTECVHRPRRLLTPEGELPLSVLRGKKTVAFSGLGSPEAFERTLEDLGAEVVPLRFRDHHKFTVDDVAKAMRLARNVGAEAVVTTEKDRVRLPLDAPFWTLEVEVEFVRGEEQFWELMRSLQIGPPKGT